MVRGRSGVGIRGVRGGQLGRGVASFDGLEEEGGVEGWGFAVFGLDLDLGAIFLSLADS